MTVAQELPPLRTRITDAQRDLEVFGLARLAGVLSPAETSAALTRLTEQAAGEDAHGCGFHDSSPEPTAAQPSGPNQRVWNLINKGEVFRRLVMNRTAHELIRHVLGKDFLLSSFTANIARKGGIAQPLHADQQYVPVATPYAVVANCAFMLCDFTADNGATKVIPGTHLGQRYPVRGETYASLPVTGPAGSLLVFDGRLWHGTGANRTDAPRYGLLAYFSRPFIRQQENFTVSVAPEVLERCSPELKALLGFKVWASLGMIGDRPTTGFHEARPTRFITELTPGAAKH